MEAEVVLLKSLEIMALTVVVAAGKVVATPMLVAQAAAQVVLQY